MRGSPSCAAPLAPLSRNRFSPIGCRPAGFRKSAICRLPICCGATEDEFRRRAAAIGREPEELRENGAAGTVDEVVAAIAKYRDAGAQRMYLQVLDLADLDHLDLVAEQGVAAGFDLDHVAGGDNLA